MAKKVYVVWKGRKTGVFESWEECKGAIEGFYGAQYKGFENRTQAEYAFAHPSSVRSGYNKSKRTARTSKSQIVWDSLSVDAACSGNPGVMEYQGVHTKSKKTIFRQKYPLGTNNIGEFLAIVHGLSHLKKTGLKLSIYTDSRIAMSWVKKKKCKTKLPENAKTKSLFDVVRRAEKWLQENDFDTPILKWDTKSWGEIPADFGRK